MCPIMNSSINMWSQNKNSELNLRDEVNMLFDGTDFGTEKFNIMLHRQIRIDSSKYPYTNKIKCNTCNHDYNNAGKPGCPSCDGIGYLWDEHLIIGRLYRPQQLRLSDQLSQFANVGRVSNASMILISPHVYKFHNGDILYEIDLTSDGGIAFPIVQKVKYMCGSSIEMRLDRNKVEFNSVVVTEIT